MGEHRRPLGAVGALPALLRQRQFRGGFDGIDADGLIRRRQQRPAVADPHRGGRDGPQASSIILRFELELALMGQGMLAVADSACCVERRHGAAARAAGRPATRRACSRSTHWGGGLIGDSPT